MMVVEGGVAEVGKLIAAIAGAAGTVVSTTLSLLSICVPIARSMAKGHYHTTATTTLSYYPFEGGAFSAVHLKEGEQLQAVAVASH